MTAQTEWKQRYASMAAQLEETQDFLEIRIGKTENSAQSRELIAEVKGLNPTPTTPPRWLLPLLLGLSLGLPLGAGLMMLFSNT